MNIKIATYLMLTVLLLNCETEDNNAPLQPETGFRVSEITFSEGDTDAAGIDAVSEEIFAYTYGDNGRLAFIEHIELLGVNGNINRSQSGVDRIQYNENNQVERIDHNTQSEHSYEIFNYASTDTNAQVTTIAGYHLDLATNEFQLSHRVSFEYDNDNRLAEQKTVNYFYGATPTVSTDTVVISYFTSGEPEKAVTTHKAVTTYESTDPENLYQPTVDVFSYNANNQLVSRVSTAENGQIVHSYTYGEQDELVEQRLVFDNDEEGALAIRYQYQYGVRCDPSAFYSRMTFNQVVAGNTLCRE